MRSCQSDVFVSPEVSSPELLSREYAAASEAAPNGWHDPSASVDGRSEAGSTVQEASEEAAAAAGQANGKTSKSKKKNKKKVRMP